VDGRVERERAVGAVFAELFSISLAVEATSLRTMHLFTGMVEIATFFIFFIQQTTEQWKMVFLIAGLMSTVTGLLFILLADAEVQSWNSPVNEKGQELKLLSNNGKETEYRLILDTGKEFDNDVKKT